MPLIRHIAKMKKPMIISTGIGTMKEVEEAVNWCLLENNDQIALLHCVANYPALPEETNLSVITSMLKKFSFPIGYSDNGESELVDIAAVSLGACIVEKHYTLDKKFDGPDHFFSIEPKDMNFELEVIEGKVFTASFFAVRSQNFFIAFLVVLC